MLQVSSSGPSPSLPSSSFPIKPVSTSNADTEETTHLDKGGGKAKVAQYYVFRGVHEDILQLDVSMHVATAVDMLKAQQQLCKQIQSFWFFEHPDTSLVLLRRRQHGGTDLLTAISKNEKERQSEVPFPR